MNTSRERTDEQRVVITGMGVTTPIGDTLAQFWDSLVNGRSGITRWKNRDVRGYSKIGGDMSDFDFEEHLKRVGVDYPDRLIAHAQKVLGPTPSCGRLTACSTLQAWKDAGLMDNPGLPAERIGHVLAGHNLNLSYILENNRIYNEEPEYIDSRFALIWSDTDVLSVSSELLSIKGPTFTVGDACATGNVALMAGLDLLRSGRSDMVLVSAAAYDLAPVLLQGYAIMGATSYRSFNDEPERACRPFDKRREGFVPSEGSVAVVLETLASAQARGARIYAELLGAASTSDASRGGKTYLSGQTRAMIGALEDAQVGAAEIDYINAHATSTVLGDRNEVAAIKAVFGSRAYEIPINATKSMLGHMLSASAVAELIATILQMQHDVLHPTINLDEPDPELDLDFVPNVARPYHMTRALSNSYGLGGLNSTVVVGRAPA